MDKFTVTSIAIDINKNSMVELLNSDVIGLHDVENDRVGIRRVLSTIVNRNLSSGYLSVDVTSVHNNTTGKTLWSEHTV